MTRFIVTRYVREASGAAASTQRGEYDNAETAYEVGYALAKAESEHLGWPVGDERMTYPARE